jgi:hypothetical protein
LLSAHPGSQLNSRGTPDIRHTALKWSLSRLIALLRQQLFVYRDLWRWIESPFEAPCPLSEQDSPQLPFTWVL